MFQHAALMWEMFCLIIKYLHSLVVDIASGERDVDRWANKLKGTVFDLHFDGLGRGSGQGGDAMHGFVAQPPLGRAVLSEQTNQRLERVRPTLGHVSVLHQLTPTRPKRLEAPNNTGKVNLCRDQVRPKHFAAADAAVTCSATPGAHAVAIASQSQVHLEPPERTARDGAQLAHLCLCEFRRESVRDGATAGRFKRQHALCGIVAGRAGKSIERRQQLGPRQHGDPTKHRLAKATHGSSLEARKRPCRRCRNAKLQRTVLPVCMAEGPVTVPVDGGGLAQDMEHSEAPRPAVCAAGNFDQGAAVGVTTLVDVVQFHGPPVLPNGCLAHHHALELLLERHTVMPNPAILKDLR
mmetsp:Transcript_129338/g.360222  ORF Transcript_129338/g.360222 Transcript_129338/m.360222 type:complete len:352 (+) Transcript_129338:1659-2714(+)